MRACVGVVLLGSLAGHTFLAVVPVVVQDEAAAAQAAVGAQRVDTLMHAAAVLLRTLVLVCRTTGKQWGLRGQTGQAAHTAEKHNDKPRLR